MALIKKLLIAAFAITVISSMIVVSYSMYLYFGAYNIVDQLDISIQKVTYSASSKKDCYDVRTFLLIENNAEFTLKLVYVKIWLYLNNSFVGVNYARDKATYYNPAVLKRGAPVNISITIKEVSSEIINTASSKVWSAQILLVILDIPLYEGAMQFPCKASYTAPN